MGAIPPRGRLHGRDGRATGGCAVRPCRGRQPFWARRWRGRLARVGPLASIVQGLVVARASRPGWTVGADRPGPSPGKEPPAGRERRPDAGWERSRPADGRTAETAVRRVVAPCVPAGGGNHVGSGRRRPQPHQQYSTSKLTRLIRRHLGLVPSGHFMAPTGVKDPGLPAALLATCCRVCWRMPSIKDST